MYVGWFRESGKRQRWRSTRAVSTEWEARTLARTAGAAFQRCDTCVLRQGIDPNVKATTN